MSALPLADGRQIVTNLTTTLGRQLKNGTWVEYPTAKYECFACHTTEGPVVGAAAVIAFGQTIRATHATHCNPYRQHLEGARAA